MKHRIRKWLLARKGRPARRVDPTNNPKDLSLEQLQRAANLAWAEDREEDLERYNQEIRSRDPRGNWHCLRCGNEEFEESSVRMQGSALSSIFDVSTVRFHTITCRRCGFTGFYKVLMPVSEKLIDFGLG